MKKLNFIFLMILVVCFLESTEKFSYDYEYSPLKIEISKELKKLLSEVEIPFIGISSEGYALAQIRTSLRKSFDLVWKRFESNKEAIKDPVIRAAIDILKIRIKEGEKSIFITFDIDKDYQKYYGDKFLITSETGEEIGTLTYEKMIKDRDVNASAANNWKNKYRNNTIKNLGRRA